MEETPKAKKVLNNLHMLSSARKKYNSVNNRFSSP